MLYPLNAFRDIFCVIGLYSVRSVRLNWAEMIRCEVDRNVTASSFVLLVWCSVLCCTCRTDFIHSHQPRRPLSPLQFHHLNLD